MSGPVVGRFHVDVDDAVRIFVNGRLVYTAGIDVSVSPELTLQPGDRVVAQLTNTAGGKWLKLVFVTADQRFAISFQKTHFRIINDLALVDFSPVEWARWKPAKVGTHKRDRLTVKNTADEVWGEGESTSIGAIISPEMFRPLPGAAGALAAPAPPLLTIEALVDGPSTLHIRQDGLIWENGHNIKPGLLKHPTFVNGKEWMPKWTNAAQERGFDRSDVFPFRLDSFDVSVELVSNMKDRGTDMVDPGRSPIDVRKRPTGIEVVIADPQSGQRWYKLVVRGRKR